nr:uncharacterized protein LOC113800434 [Penaeus vannamei]
MGVAKVFLYETDVAPTLSQVLRHYEQDGLVSTLPYSYPPPYPNHPATRWIWRHLESENYFSQENVYFSDCVLRHMHEYRFIAHFDPDEVPVLPHHQTLPGLVAELLRTSSGKAYPAYNLQMINFYEDLPPVEEVRDLPPFLWVLRHTARLKEDPAFVTGHSKPIFDMDFARGVFSHAPVTCVGMCEAVKRVSPSLAYLGHFKGTCGEKCQDKDLLRTETAHLRYRDLVLQAVTSVKKKLQLV